MRRKLLLLNLALVALLGAVAWKFSRIHEDFQAREAAVLKMAPALAPIASAPPVEPPEPLVAANYIEIADKLLFVPDRNPQVVLEPEKKPLPPLPFAHGVLDLGAGPTAILSEKANSPQRACLPGDRIGEFTLVQVAGSELVFEWEGEQVRRTLEELRPPKESARPAPPVVAKAPKPAVVQPQAKSLGAESKSGPSDVDVGGGMRACKPGDTSEAGTVSEGYKKVVTRTPFGNACRWVPVE